MIQNIKKNIKKYAITRAFDRANNLENINNQTPLSVTDAVNSRRNYSHFLIVPNLVPVHQTVLAYVTRRRIIVHRTSTSCGLYGGAIDP